MATTGQSVGDLRTLVTRRVGSQRRVALLGTDGGLLRGIEANGCTVLVDPASTEEMTAFQPDVVVAFDGFAQDDGAGAFDLLARSLPQAELVFSFANAASATAAIGALTGATPTRALAERDVRQWLRSAGFVVTSRDLVVVPHAPSGLSADTEAAFRQLFEQLNPDAAVDRVLYVARRGVVASPADRTPGLLSVVVSSGPTVSALATTLVSLGNQPQRPLEVVVASPLSLEQTDSVFAKLRARPGISVVTVASTSADWAERTNAGIAAAQGQYLACLEAGDTVSPSHFGPLVQALAAGTRAWALGFVAGTSPLTTFSLANWLRAEMVHRQALVVDRDRVATFPLSFAEGVDGAEAMRFARLAALFEPEWRLPPMPGVECGRAQPTSDADAVQTVLAVTRTRPLRVLRSLTDWLQHQDSTARLRDVLKARAKDLVDRTKPR